MARKIVVPFAADGDRVAIPDAVQGDGSVSFTQGFGFDYSRPIGSSPAAKNVPRTGVNELYHVITEVLQQFQQQGAPEWYASTPYAQFARVKHEGDYYVALVDETEQEPGTGSEWAPVNVPAKRISVKAVATATYNLDAEDESAYLRFTFSGAKSMTVRPNSTHVLPTDGSFPIRNADTGDLTLVEGAGVTINPEAGGTLVLEPGMTVTLQKVGTDEYDLIGHTVAA